MASEAGILGTPSFMSAQYSGVIMKIRKKHGTVFNFNGFEGLLDKSMIF